MAGICLAEFACSIPLDSLQVPHHLPKVQSNLGEFVSLNCPQCVNGCPVMERLSSALFPVLPATGSRLTGYTVVIDGWMDGRMEAMLACPGHGRPSH